MRKKDIHLILSISSFLLGLVLFLTDYISDETLQNLGLLFFGLLIMGWYGITKYIYDK
ncbi:hypothetical protein RJI07_01035 [Mycoplasmatota bacterium WC30]